MKYFRTLASIFFLTSIIQGAVDQNGDFQIWNYWSVDKTIKNNWGARLMGEGRWGNNASELYFVYFQAQAVNTTKWLEIAPGFRQAFVRLAQDIHHIPLVDITLFLPGTWQWEDRNRFFYVIPEDAPSHFVYRNRLRLISPEVTRFLKLKLFADDEFFYHEGRGISQNRASIGLLSTHTAYLKLRLYYTYRLLKQEPIWTYQNVMAIHIIFNF